jgi:AmmeMemoRadiSam system protein B
VAAVVDDLAQIRGTLFLISSDLSHFLDDRHARDSDRRTRDKILARRPTITGMEACGASALNGFLSSRLARRLSVELVDMANSGDVTGDRDRVVGYGSFVLR